MEVFTLRKIAAKILLIVVLAVLVGFKADFVKYSDNNSKLIVDLNDPVPKSPHSFTNNV